MKLKVTITAVDAVTIPVPTGETRVRLDDRKKPVIDPATGEPMMEPILRPAPMRAVYVTGKPYDAHSGEAIIQSGDIVIVMTPAQAKEFDIGEEYEIELRPVAPPS
jgi:hypothetical protein